MAEIVEHQRQVGKSTHTPNLTLSNYERRGMLMDLAKPLLIAACLLALLRVDT